jgi:hypothetical protein
MTFLPVPARTWLSYPEEPPEDFPEYFTTEDMENENLPVNEAGMKAAAKQKALFDSWTEDVP